MFFAVKIAGKVLVREVSAVLAPVLLIVDVLAREGVQEKAPSKSRHCQNWPDPPFLANFGILVDLTTKRA